METTDTAQGFDLEMYRDLIELGYAREVARWYATLRSAPNDNPHPLEPPGPRG